MGETKFGKREARRKVREYLAGWLDSLDLPGPDAFPEECDAFWSEEIARAVRLIYPQMETRVHW